MTAKEAKTLSNKNATRLEALKAGEHKRRSEAARKGRIEGHKRWKKDFFKTIEYSIHLAVEAGETQYEKTMDSRGHVSELYGRENFLKNFEYAKELKSIMKSLVSGGYAVSLDGRPVKHDDSGAYLNSGGECGSEEPYWTYDTILTVKW
jgi:hypothetical protein